MFEVPTKALKNESVLLQASGSYWNFAIGLTKPWRTRDQA